MSPLAKYKNIDSGATISKDGLYRYRLWRIWDRKKPMIMFLMLNPSTADGEIDDLTIIRCKRFAKFWGYGGFWVGNLFAYRSRFPKKLKEVDDPIGPENNVHITYMAEKSAKIVLGFGNYAASVIKHVPLKYAKILDHRPLYCLDISTSGYPKHPLYLSAYSTLKIFPDSLKDLFKNSKSL